MSCDSLQGAIKVLENSRSTYDVVVGNITICYHKKTGLWILPGSYFKGNAILVSKDEAIMIAKRANLDFFGE